MSGPRAWLIAAACAGGLHAAWSAYWALGGRWLLPTVGQWAARLADEQPVEAGLALGVVAVVKALAAWLPLVWWRGRLPLARAWWWLFAGGAVVLVAYGGLNVTVSWAVLSGLIPTPDGIDRTAQLGHAALWDPLFLAWGLLLGVGLHRSRRAGGHAASSDGH